MTLRKLLESLRWTAATLFISAVFCPAVFAQELVAAAPLPDAPMPPALVEAVTPAATTTAHLQSEHKFWDKQNCVLFIAAAGMHGADFAVTRANLQSGGQELNPLVRPFGQSTAGLAANFVGETAAVATISYFFHKTGHHKLELAVYLVNIGSSAGAVSFGLVNR